MDMQQREDKEAQANQKQTKLHRSTYDPRAGHTLPTHGDYARTLAAGHTQGILSTLDRDDQTPYGSIVELLPLEDGSFVFLVSGMAEHTKNLKKDPKCSLLVAEGIGHGEALALSRATFIGTAEKVQDGAALYREKFLEVHPTAHVYIDFPDFSFFKLSVSRLRYIGGFGRMSWIDQEAYAEAQPDPLWQSATGIIEHMNDDHKHNMIDYAHAFCDVEGEIDDIVMTILDRFGFEMRMRQGDTERTLRLSFSEELTSADQVRPEVVRMAKEAREILGKTK